jgi:thioredoxin 1
MRHSLLSGSSKTLQFLVARGLLLFLAAVLLLLPSIVTGKEATATAGPLPRLVDIGAKKCIPCKMMAPVLEELQRDYTETIIVDFIDVWENPDAAKPYKIRTIPTQIFYDASGKELTRHMGYISKEAILKTFKDHGIEVKKNTGKGR